MSDNCLGCGAPLNNSVRIELADPQGQLLEEIGNPAMKRDDVALTYALALKSADRVDWAVVNDRIIGRWSISALRYIKDRAWKLAEAKAAARESAR